MGDEFMELIPAKTLMQKVKPTDSAWFHHDYNLNLYRGCSHGCIYCDSRSECYQIDDFDKVKMKANAIDILESEMRKKRSRGIIGFGAMSDPYNPLEKQTLLMRNTLLLAEKYGYSVSIATKSHLILRDIDILERISKHHIVNVSITITCAEDSLQKILEPRASTSSERFEAIRILRDKGIFTGILMMPILPYINDTLSNVEGLIHYASLSGANYIIPGFGVTLRDRQRDYFYNQLDDLFPGLRERYEATYHQQYGCESPQKKMLAARFESLCQKVGILSRFQTVNSKMLNLETQKQLAFDFSD